MKFISRIPDQGDVRVTGRDGRQWQLSRKSVQVAWEKGRRGVANKQAAVTDCQLVWLLRAKSDRRFWTGGLF
jgi:hypothetical protein